MHVRHKSHQKQFEIVSREVQRFGISLRVLYNYDPKGSVSRTQIHAMACAIHTGRTSKMEYHFIQDSPREQWTQYDSFVVLQDSATFSITGTAGGDAQRGGKTPGSYVLSTSESGATPGCNVGNESGGGGQDVEDGGGGGHGVEAAANVAGSSDTFRRGTGITDAGSTGSGGDGSGGDVAGGEGSGSGGQKRNHDSAPIGRKAAKEAKTEELYWQQRAAQDKMIADSLESKAADAKLFTATLADTNMFLTCGSAMDREITEDRDQRMQLMRMYRRTKLEEMKAKPAKQVDAIDDSEISVDDDNSNNEDI